MLIISEEDARQLVGVEDAIAAVEAAFAAMAKGEALNYPVVREALGVKEAVFGVKSGFDRLGPVLGLKAGLDARTVFEMVTAGAANSRVFELRAPMMVKNRYDGASMKLSVWQKDMAVIGDFARRLAVPTPLFDATVPVYRRALRTGHAGHDTAAVCAVLEAMAGVKRGKQRTQHVKLAENRKVGKGA